MLIVLLIMAIIINVNYVRVFVFLTVTLLDGGDEIHDHNLAL